MRTFYALALTLFLARAGWATGPAKCAAQGESIAARDCLFALANDGSRAAVVRHVAEKLRARPADPFYLLIRGDLEFAQGELGAAEGSFRAAVLAAERDGALWIELTARGAWSRVLSDQGRLDEATAAAASTLAVAERSGRGELVQQARQVVLIRLQEAGRFADGIAAFERWHADATQAPAARRYEFLRTAGNLLTSGGRFDEAQSVFGELELLAQKESRMDWLAQALYGQYRVVTERASEVPSPEATARSRALAESALAAALAAPPGAARSEVGAYSHWALGMLADGAAADAHFAACLEFAQDAATESYCLTGWSRVLGRDGRGELAWQRAADALEKAQSGTAEAKVQAWRERMHASWAARDAATAIAASEEALAKIDGLRRLQENRALQASVFSTWTDDYLWFSGKVLATSDPALLPVAFAVTEQMRARSLLDQLAPSTAAAEDFASLADLQAALAPDEALLSYQIAPWQGWDRDFGGGSWLLVITRGGVGVQRLERDRTFWRQTVRTFVGLTAGRDGREEESAVVLHGDLLAPALADLPPGIRRLVLIPDDVLHKLPFELLREHAGAPPLGTRFEVSRVPSATLWLRWRRAAAEAVELPAWILADPAPLAPGPGGRPLPPLPYARREGDEIARRLGAGSRLLVGLEAGESRVRSLEPRLAAVLHFGTHAIVDEDDADRSAIYLGADSGGGSGVDGRIELAEIAALPIAGRLVVLSSCESAAGVLLRGEGVLSLARAFFEGGRTRAVVASLWPLRDDDALAFFRLFYRHLAGGETVAAAARAVRGELLAAGAPAEAWGGVVVLGDGELVPVVPRGAREERPWEALGVALAGGLAAAWNRRGAQRQASR